VKKAKRKTGPKPDLLKIEGDWRKAVGKALEKKRPDKGWPKQQTTRKKKRAK
jgi:hypothetical protein